MQLPFASYLSGSMKHRVDQINQAHA